jgi:hypothetical protein
MDRGLIQLVRAFEIQMKHEATSVRTGLQAVVQRHIWATAYRNRLGVTADTSIDEHRTTLDFATVISEKSMGGFVGMLVFGLGLHCNPERVMDELVPLIAEDIDLRKGCDGKSSVDKPSWLFMR